MASGLGLSVAEVVSDPLKLKEIDLKRYVDENTGLSTLNDILYELEKPGRDPRDKAVTVEFDDTINDIADLREGMILPGIVNNMAEKRIQNPSQVVRLNQHVKVKVIEVDIKRGRIALTLRGVEQ